MRSAQRVRACTRPGHLASRTLKAAPRRMTAALGTAARPPRDRLPTQLAQGRRAPPATHTTDLLPLAAAQQAGHSAMVKVLRKR